MSHSTEHSFNDDALSTISQFADELEVHIDDVSKTAVVPKRRSLVRRPTRAVTLPPPAVTTPQSMENNGDNALRESHSAIVLSSNEVSCPLASHSSSSLFLSPTFNTSLKKSVSLTNFDTPLFILGLEDDEKGLKAESENFISISLSDFDDFNETRQVTDCRYCRLAEIRSRDLLVKGLAEPKSAKDIDEESSASNSAIVSSSSSSLSSDNSKGESTLVVPSNLVTCPSYSSLNATADISHPLKLIDTPEEDDNIRVIKRGMKTLESSDMSATSSSSIHRPRHLHHRYHNHHHHHHSPYLAHHRKRFVLKPQHSPLTTLKSESKDLEYVTEIPETFRFGHKVSAMTDSTATRVMRRVAKNPPPLLPAQLESTFINSSVRASKDEIEETGIPNHVVLNHLATTSIKHDVLAVASTSRYRAKFCKLHVQVGSTVC